MVRPREREREREKDGRKLRLAASLVWRPVYRQPLDTATREKQRLNDSWRIFKF